MKGYAWGYKMGYRMGAWLFMKLGVPREAFKQEYLK